MIISKISKDMKIDKIQEEMNNLLKSSSNISQATSLSYTNGF